MQPADIQLHTIYSEHIIRDFRETLASVQSGCIFAPEFQVLIDMLIQRSRMKACGLVPARKYPLVITQVEVGIGLGCDLADRLSIVRMTTRVIN